MSDVLLEVLCTLRQRYEFAFRLASRDFARRNDATEDTEVKRRGVAELRLNDDIVLGERFELPARILLYENREHLIRNYGNAGELLACQQWEAHVHDNQNIDPHLPRNIDRHVLCNTAVNEEPAIALYRRKNSRRR